MKTSDTMTQWVDDFFEDLQIGEDGVVMIHDEGAFDALSMRVFLKELSTRLKQGTIGVFGDHTLNDHVASNENLESLTTQERMVLGSGVLLQLLTLDKMSSFASHPSHLIGFKGKYAPYLSRQLDLDFPYGAVSIYNDLYGMDAFIIHLGDIKSIPECFHAYSKREDAVIQKNTALKRGEIVSFLDYDINEPKLIDALHHLGLVQSFNYGDHYIHVYKYQEVIDALRLYPF